MVGVRDSDMEMRGELVHKSQKERRWLRWVMDRCTDNGRKKQWQEISNAGIFLV